jgi:uncharacterized protein (TIGR00304 family)
MISQTLSGIEMLAYGIIIAGILVVILGIWFMFNSNEEQGTEVKRESKAIVFIGPIPLVWGYSRRTQGILFVIALTIFIIWILWVW